MQKIAQQLRVAKDFANIFDNVEEVLSEARQGVKPDLYLPAKNSKHRAPVRKSGGTRAKKNHQHDTKSHRGH